MLPILQNCLRAIYKPLDLPIFLGKPVKEVLHFKTIITLQNMASKENIVMKFCV